MSTFNQFQQAAIDLKIHRTLRPKIGRVVTTTDGIDAKPLSWFSEAGQRLMLHLIACGEIEFLLHEDVLLIPVAEIDPYMPAGHEWRE